MMPGVAAPRPVRSRFFVLSPTRSCTRSRTRRSRPQGDDHVIARRASENAAPTDSGYTLLAPPFVARGLHAPASPTVTQTTHDHKHQAVQRGILSNTAMPAHNHPRTETRQDVAWAPRAPERRTCCACSGGRPLMDTPARGVPNMSSTTSSVTVSWNVPCSRSVFSNCSSSLSATVSRQRHTSGRYRTPHIHAIATVPTAVGQAHHPLPHHALAAYRVGGCSRPRGRGFVSQRQSFRRPFVLPWHACP